MESNAAPISCQNDAPRLYQHVRPDRLLEWYGLVALCMLLGLVLRAGAADEHSVWYDEAVTARLTRASSLDLLTGEAGDNGNPPVYWVAARVSALLGGRSETALRTLPVLCGTLTIPLLALLGRWLVSPAAGATAAGLLAVSPLAVALSNEARPYALLHLLAVVNMLAFVAWLKNRRRTALAGYIVSLALCCLTHYFAIFVPLAQGTALVVVPEKRKLLGRWMAAVGTAALLSAFWVPAFLDQLGRAGNLSRFGADWYLQFLATPLGFSFGRTLVWRSAPFPVLVLASVAAVLTCGVAVLLGLWRHRREPRGEGALLVAWLALPIAVPFVAAVTLSPMYHIRAGSIALPAFLLLAGTGIWSLRRGPAVVVAASVVVLTAVSLANYGTRPLKDDWRSASRVLLDERKPDVPILFDEDIQAVPFQYYADRMGREAGRQFGVVDLPGEKTDRITGVEWDGRRRLDAEASDCTDEILASSGVWLALCVPNGDPEDYRSFFANHGYQVVERHRFYRIELLRFARTGALRRDKGSGRDGESGNDVFSVSATGK